VEYFSRAVTSNSTMQCYPKILARVRSLCNGYPLGYFGRGVELTCFDPFQALENCFLRASGGVGLTRGKETRDPKLGRQGGGGGA
jgi:hypothetical protein